MQKPDLRPPDNGPAGYPAVSVGRLAAGQTFDEGEVQPRLVRKIRRATLKKFRQTRGFHLCDLCVDKGQDREPAKVKHLWRVRRLGSAELCVINPEGTAFVAPDLLLHYIEEHRYLPPAEFLDAIMRGKVFSDKRSFRRGYNNE